jgi:hypothetical protein
LLRRPAKAEVLAMMGYGLFTNPLILEMENHHLLPIALNFGNRLNFILAISGLSAVNQFFFSLSTRSTSGGWE